MAFNRIVEVEIGNNIGTNLRLSNLDIAFEIERSFDLSSNTANFTIYNAKEETRQKILKPKNNIIFKAGYEDEGNTGTIFTGIITESTSKKQDTEWMTEIQATDFSSNTSNLLKETAELSYSKRTPLSQIVNDVRGLLNVPLAGLDNITTVLNHNFVYSGDMRGLIKELEKVLLPINLGLYFDNSEMVIYVLGQQNSKFGTVRITPQSGLIGEIEEIKDDKKDDGKKRYSISTLLNPKIKPNVLVQVQSSKVNGLFIVEKVRFTGDNFGGDFTCGIEAVE